MDYRNLTAWAFIAIATVLCCIALLIWDGKKNGQQRYSASEREMEKLSWPDYLAALLVKSFRNSGYGLSLIVVAIVGSLVFLVMLLLGHDDMVPERFLWLKQLLFWR